MEMLAWFNRHPEALKDWVNKLPYVLLTNYNGSAEYRQFLINVKSRLTESLSSYTGEFKNEANSILKVVSSSPVREVD